MCVIIMFVNILLCDFLVNKRQVNFMYSFFSYNNYYTSYIILDKLLKPSRFYVQPHLLTVSNEWKHWIKTFNN